MNQQLKLDEWPHGSRPARARRTDPESSHVAADVAERVGTVACHMSIVLAAVKGYPGLTSKRLAETCPLDRYQVARRLPELETRGLVTRTSAPDGDRWFPA
jgi:hypothetical protein